MAFDAIVVDLDGTIWDSFPWYASILGELADQDEESLLDELTSGCNLIHLLQRADLGRDRFFRECINRADSLSLFPDVEETLRGFKACNIPLGVFTSLPNALAQSICDVKNLSTLFSAFEAARRGRRPKPNPQGILDALNNMGINPTPSACYVGDLPVDATAAQAAGISFIWARYGYGDLTDEPRDAEIDSFAELTTL